MKLKIKTTQEIDLDITFPYFCEYGGTFFKVFGESEYIDVMPNNQITYYGSTQFNLFLEAREISEEQFNEARNNTIEYLKNK